MNYDTAEDHLKSAYLAAAKCLSKFRERGINDSAAEELLNYEFAAWSMLDRLSR